MLSQIYIFDTKTANLILQKAYLVNNLVNPQDLEHIFYKTNIFLEH